MLVKLGPNATIYADNKHKVLLEQLVEVDETPQTLKAVNEQHLVRATDAEASAYQKAKDAESAALAKEKKA